MPAFCCALTNYKAAVIVEEFICYQKNTATNISSLIGAFFGILSNKQAPELKTGRKKWTGKNAIVNLC